VATGALIDETTPECLLREGLYLQWDKHSPRHKSVKSICATGALMDEARLEKLLSEVPIKWERLGDMVLLPNNSFGSGAWSRLGGRLWEAVADALGADRVARQAPIAKTGVHTQDLGLGVRVREHFDSDNPDHRGNAPLKTADEH
jgi:tRNA wybutosine-synthesizing protein 3